jgi:hypothetical protein
MTFQTGSGSKHAISFAAAPGTDAASPPGHGFRPTHVLANR